MPNTIEISKRITGLSIAIALVQVFDIVIHVATDQVEPIRITSNIIIFVWLAMMSSGKFEAQNRLMALGAIGAYLVLNLIFLALEGVTNSENGEFRTMLFILLTLTIGLSALMTYLQENDKRNYSSDEP